MSVTRRGTILGVTAALALAGRASAAEPVHIAVTKGPGCSCCEGWAKHLREAGFAVTVSESTELDALKAKLGIPADLRTCHTASVGNTGYILEGHVPAPAVRYLLHEKPQNVTGLAVPGMPAGSPGMEVEGTPAEEYSVIVFGPGGRKVWAKFRGAVEACG
jgi:hypothetical protein